MNVCDQCGNEFETVKRMDFPYSTETHPDGTKTILTQPLYVSPCCEDGYEPFTEQD